VTQEFKDRAARFHLQISHSFLAAASEKQTQMGGGGHAMHGHVTASANMRRQGAGGISQVGLADPNEAAGATRPRTMLNIRHGILMIVFSSSRFGCARCYRSRTAQGATAQHALVLKFVVFVSFIDL
jgi:hypothetical protein